MTISPTHAYSLSLSCKQLQRIVTHCNILQHIAALCNTHLQVSFLEEESLPAPYTYVKHSFPRRFVYGTSPVPYAKR